MNDDRHNFRSAARRIEPLPIDFEPALGEVDRLLSRAVQSSAKEVPAGLSQRIFEMSVQALPADIQTPADLVMLHLTDADAPAPVPVMVTTRRLTFAGWSRLAMAASVLVVAGLTLWTTWPRSQSTTPVAHTTPDGAPTPTNPPVVHAASFDFGALNAFSAANPSALDAYEATSTYLLDASEVRSFDDLNNDLRQLVAQLEM